MKWQFKAIDETGRPVGGVLEAEDEVSGRLALLDASIFPKRIQPTDDSAKLTWKSVSAPVARLKQRIQENNISLETTPMMSFPVSAQQVELREKMMFSLFANRLELRSLDDDSAEPVVIDQGELELSRIVGSLTKYWELVTASGRSIMIEAGTVLIRREIREANEVLQSWFRD
ncbi:MAG: hypothetical protein ACFCU1_12280 [Sumerlaeia bacterium]